jgi:hypothetical protein
VSDNNLSGKEKKELYDLVIKEYQSRKGIEKDKSDRNDICYSACDDNCNCYGGGLVAVGAVYGTCVVGGYTHDW